MSTNNYSEPIHSDPQQIKTSTGMRKSRPIERHKQRCIVRKRLPDAIMPRDSVQKTEPDTSWIEKDTASDHLSEFPDDQIETMESSQADKKANQQATLEKEAEPTSRQKQKSAKKHQKRTKRIRILPIWLRLIIILVLCVVALFAGLAFGYSVLGDGPVKDVLKWDTFQHIIDIVNKEN